MTSWRITETNTGVQFSLKIQPRAAKNEISGIQGDALKLRLTAPPVDGEANEACIRFIAQWLKIARNTVEIVTGHTSRHKIVQVKGLSKEQLLERVGTDVK
ncbi:MAG: YggU family protein [Firmicutes bacterium HGW-Firmicutes-12]|jgi:hypothetical protein|nr:MAG: YggU family protein [Firmicutes bacterium HGW-Firmicutes-12]